jgi:hypothetical protein
VPKRVPIETLIAGGLIPFTPAETGWASNWIMSGNLQEITNQLKSGFLGMDIRTGNIDIMRLANPFDMERGRFTKMLLLATLIGTVRSKLTGKYTQPLFNKIPMIGRFLK